MRWICVPVVAGVLVAASVGGVAAQDESELSDPPAIDAQAVSAMAMEAWASGDDEAIEAVYDPAVVMIIDGDELAADRDGITAVINGAITSGNTYTQVGPVIQYEHSNGDTFIASLIEVHGRGHPLGVPVVGFYRVHDGKVTRHVFMDAEHY